MTTGETRPARHPARVPVALLLITLLLPLLSATPAQATGYRYWSFWERGEGGWVYASQGPSLVRPVDGAVQGFRFSVSEDSRDSAKPRGAAGFGAICGDTPAKGGSKRVALVLDFGTAEDAPDGGTPPEPRTACARVAEDASTAEALAAVARPLRYDGNALLCAIAGYPATGCGETVADGGGGKGESGGGSSKPAETPENGKGGKDTASAGGSGDGGPSVGLLGGGAVVVVLGLAAVLRARRRSG